MNQSSDKQLTDAGKDLRITPPEKDGSYFVKLQQHQEEFLRWLETANDERMGIVKSQFRKIR